VGPLFFILWILAQSNASVRLAEDVAASGKRGTLMKPPQRIRPEATPALRPGQMSMFSAYVPRDAQEEKCRIRCRTDRSINNIDIHIPIEAVVEEDVVGQSGKTLIPAGTKVVGQGYCDAEAGRILSRGKWTFYAVDHQITADATMWDESRKEGLAGVQLSEGVDEERIKQAIYRDGAYLYVPSQTRMLLELRGAIAVQDLASAFEK
jgi:hypothetical protein